MDVLRGVLTVPGMGAAFAASVITLWLLFLMALVLWVARAPREGSGE